MASSYAALVSLVHVLNRVQHPSCPASFDKLQIQSLFEKVHFLINFLEAYSQRTGQDLARKMVDVAFAAEDKIETYITDQVLERSSCDDAYDVLLNDLENIMQEIDLIIQETMGVEKNIEMDQGSRSNNVDVVSSTERPVEMVKMVGFDNELTLLINQLTARQSSTRIIPIVGMGGIGKTTLARNVYNHPRLNNIFDVKAWVTISQEYKVGKIIRSLLRDIGIVGEIHDAELGDKLHKSLYGRKYLLILDDIWDTKAWDAISRFCPDNNKGSRIILTSRILDVARSITTYTPFDIQLLDADKSWNLLSRTVFEKESNCPLELVECGKKISKSCKGLPLAIAVIGGLLKTSEMTQEHWEDVAENINSIISGEDGEHCLNILSLSYHHLPIHLKPCFFYFATFRYDSRIVVSRLIKLWAADGCLKPSNEGNITLEEVALKYLTDLVSRNLITIDRLTSLGEIKFLTVHDLVMDLCVREVQKERFLYLVRANEEFPENERRVVFRGTGDSECTKNMHPKGFARSFIALRGENSPSDISRLSLLRTFVVPVNCETSDFRQLCNLRLVQLVCYSRRDLFSNLSSMWNLETLIVIEGQLDLHPGIWSLQHIIFRESFSFPDPPPTLDARFAFQNLQTLEGVQNLTDKLLDMVPNIQRLVTSIDFDSEQPHGYDKLAHGYDKLACCHKLEILKLVDIDMNELKKMNFPNSLRKLHLNSTKILHGCSFGLLPNLEVLRISETCFESDKWNTVEGEFQNLKVLSISSETLQFWSIDDCYPFPSLERLQLTSMFSLEEIPEIFGESTTLESITLDDCSMSACISAKRILDVQQSLGNFGLTVQTVNYFSFSGGNNKDKRACLESMADDNFHVTIREEDD